MKAVVNQAGRYASFAAWFFKDALLRYRGRLTVLVVANVSGVALQALAVLIAYRYASAIEAGSTLELAGIAFEPRESTTLLACTAIAVFLLVVISAVLVMRSRVAGARVALDYGDFCAQRIYLLLSRLPRTGAASPKGEYTLQRFFELTRRDAAYCGLVLRTMAYSLRHIGTVIAAGLALLFLDPYLTLVVIAILAVAAVFLRRTSIRGASHRDRVQRHAVDRARERLMMEDRVSRNPAALHSSDPAWRILAEGSTAEFRRATLGQRYALENGKLIAQIAIGCALFLVLFVQGGATLSKASNWSALLVYVAALSFFGTSLARVGRALVSINRFYPPLARHARFVEKSENDLRGDLEPSSGPYVLSVPALGQHASPELEIRRGDRLGLILPVEVTRFSMIPFARALRLLGADRRVSEAVPFPWFVSHGSTVTGTTLAGYLGLRDEREVAELHAMAKSVDAGEGFIALPASLDEPLGHGCNQSPSSPILFALTTLAGLIGRQPIIVLEHNGLASLPDRTRRRLVEEVASRSAAFIGHRANAAASIGTCGESSVVICGSEEVLGWASIEIFREQGDAVQRALARSASEARVARGASFVGEDDLEDLE